MRVPYGTIQSPYWEWWLHHNPFRRYCQDQRSCPVCESDTGCLRECPQEEIISKINEITELMHNWNERSSR